MNPDARNLIEQWIAKQSAHAPLLPSRIVRDLRDQVGSNDVVDALVALKRDGLIRSVYAIRLPTTGSVARKVYYALDQIEPEVRDQFNRPVPRDELEVLQAYEKVEQ